MSDLVRLGRIAGPHGLKGWVKVWSDTEPRGAILAYQPWLVGERHEEMRVLESAERGRWIVASLAGVGDRDAALELAGLDIAVRRDQLADPGANRYYWADLLGCTVWTTGGVALGELAAMMETGAHDVMLVRGDRERLIPFVPDRYVRSVDIGSRRIEVDWDPEF